MSSILWTGKISLPLRLIINFAAIMAWFTGNARKPSVMKERVNEGYDGNISEYISKYDELANKHYEKIASLLMDRVDCTGKRVVDIGCGTGILSFIGLEKGAFHMSCVDPSQNMLDMCMKKSVSKGYSKELISFSKGDSKRLPFDDASFDVVLSNMVLGMIPDQQDALIEFNRILRPGGILARYSGSY